MSPTTITGYIRVAVALAIMIWVITQVWIGWGDAVAVTAIAVYVVADRLLGMVESHFTADNKDVKKLEDKVDQ